MSTKCDAYASCSECPDRPICYIGLGASQNPSCSLPTECAPLMTALTDAKQLRKEVERLQQWVTDLNGGTPVEPGTPTLLESARLEAEALRAQMDLIRGSLAEARTQLAEAHTQVVEAHVQLTKVDNRLGIAQTEAAALVEQ